MAKGKRAAEIESAAAPFAGGVCDPERTQGLVARSTGPHTLVTRGPDCSSLEVTKQGAAAI
jgi:hypothetical protein